MRRYLNPFQSSFRVTGSRSKGDRHGCHLKVFGPSNMHTIICTLHTCTDGMLQSRLKFVGQLQIQAVDLNQYVRSHLILGHKTFFSTRMVGKKSGYHLNSFTSNLQINFSYITSKMQTDINAYLPLTSDLEKSHHKGQCYNSGNSVWQQPR